MRYTVGTRVRVYVVSNKYVGLGIIVKRMHLQYEVRLLQVIKEVKPSWVGQSIFLQEEQLKLENGIEIIKKRHNL